MGRGFNSGASFPRAVMVAVLTVLICRAAAEEYIVGDETGWVAPNSPDFYATWASKHAFAVGDVLAFNFVIGSHTVAESEQTAYDNCDNSKVIVLHKDGPVKITLTKEGQNYFFCTIHCSSGQKLTINVLPASDDKQAPSLAPSSNSSSSESPSMEPSSSGSLAPAPLQDTLQDNSAVSASSSGIFLVCLSFVLSLLF